MVATGLAAAVAVAWVSVVLLTVGHGFDVTDEGYYLLTYRWWDAGIPSHSGVQYLYGPIFELLGHNVVALRVFRLLTILATHAALGWAFMRWLRVHRPLAPATPWWEAAGATVIVACGAIVYSWLPSTPGYNDVANLGALLAAAIMIRIVADVERGVRTPAWVPAALGPLAVVMLLAKWSSALCTFAVLLVVGILAVRRRSWREVGRMIGWAAGGGLLAALVIQLLVVPMTSLVPDLLEVNRRLTGTGYGPRELVGMYVFFAVPDLVAAAKANAVLLVAAVAATLAKGRIWRWGALVLVVTGLTLSLVRILADGSWTGGPFNGYRFIPALYGLLLVPAAIGVTAMARDGLAILLRGRSTRWGQGGQPLSSLTATGGRSWPVLGLLILVPVTQAAGTNVALHDMAINGLGAWAAVAIAIATGVEAAPATARRLAIVVTAGLVALTTSVAINGVWVNPYRSPGRAQTTAAVPDVPALSGIQVDPASARLYVALRRALRPWVDSPGRAIIAYDEIAGLAYVLDGRPVGEAWNGAATPFRTADSVRADCRGADPWWGERAPILIFNRPVTDVEIATLRDCGYDFATTYRLLAPPEQMHGLVVYVPDGR